MDEKLLNLPLHIQIALGSGYLAYLVAYAGIRQHHTAPEIFFRSIAFGMVATSIMLWAPLGPEAFAQWRHPFWRPASAVFATVATGAFWRWRGMRWCKAFLHAVDVSWTDDIPTAWLSITAMDTNVGPTQIAVDLENGRTLLCEDTRAFEGAPHKPCVFGLDGSIAMYVTSERRSDGEWVEKYDVRHPTEGDLLTYVPAAQIKRVELRLAKLSRRAWWRRGWDWARRCWRRRLWLN